MNRKILIVVAAATAIALIAAISVQNRKKPASEFTASASALLPTLSAEMDKLDKLRLSGAAGTEIVTLQRSDKGWVVVNRDGYPADATKLRELVLKLADARAIEAKTRQRDRYSQLGVEDIIAADAKGVLLELEGLSTPARIIIGNVNGGGGGGTFVRRADEDQSWLINGTVTIERAVSDWIARDIADVPSQRIRSVTIDKAGKTLRVGKSAAGDGNFVIADIPKGREASSEFAANGLASTLSGLRVDDVVIAAGDPPADAIKVRYALFDGIVIKATAWSNEGRHLARFAASVDQTAMGDWIALEQAKLDTAYESELASANGKTVGTEEPAKPLALSHPEQDRDARRAAVQAEVDALSASFGTWTFAIPAYKFDMIDKSMDDLLAAPTGKAGKGG